MLSAQFYLMFLRRNTRLCLGVSVGAAMVAYVLTVLFPGMDPRDAQIVSSTWPPVMKSLFGDPALAFSDVYAWLNMEMFHMTCWVVYGALAAVLASRLVAREREERTLEVLLAHPIARTGVVVSGLLGVATLLALAMVPFALALGLGVVTLGLPLRVGILLLACAAGLLLSFFCAAAAILASALGAGQTLSAFLSLAVTAFLFLFSSVLVRFVPSLQALAFASPFHAYRTEEILVQGWPDARVLALLAYAAIPAIAAVVAFSKRDILA